MDEKKIVKHKADYKVVIMSVTVSPRIDGTTTGAFVGLFFKDTSIAVNAADTKYKFSINIW